MPQDLVSSQPELEWILLFTQEIYCQFNHR